MAVFTTDFDIVKASLLATFFGIGGWLGFVSVREILNLEQLSPFVSLGISVFIFWLGFKLGLRKD